MPRANGKPYKRNGEDARVSVRFDYRPFRQTIDLHLAFETFRERVAVTGSRGGKTTAGIADTRDKAIEQPDYNYDDIDAGIPYNIFIGAPDFPRVNKIILPALLRSIPQSIIAKPYHHTDHLLKLYGKKGITDIYIMSAQFPDRWQGIKADGIWLDEFALMKEGMYDEARTRLFDRHGWLLLTGTPKGPNWAFDRIYKPWVEDQKRIQNGEEPLRSDLYFSTWRTTDNPRLPAGAKEDLARYRASMPEKYFKRTYEASWDVFEGQVYEEWLDEVHVARLRDYTFVSGTKSVGSGKKVIRLVRVVAGVDWGNTPEHKGVILVLGQSAQGVWYVLDESVAPFPGADARSTASLLIRGRTLKDDSWVKRALDLRDKWKISTFFCDPSRPENLRMFREEGLQVQSALNRIPPGIECVARHIHVNDEALDRGEPATRFQVLDTCRVTIDEIRIYHRKQGKEEPEKVLDDTMDALRYALYTAEKRDIGGRKANFDFA